MRLDLSCILSSHAHQAFLGWRDTKINVDIEPLSDLINYLSDGMESLKDDR